MVLLDLAYAEVCIEGFKPISKFLVAIHAP